MFERLAGTHRTIRFSFLLSLIFATPLVAKAELRVARIFSNHMVLQREKPIVVWGWARAGSNVRVAFDGNATNVTASKEGRWTATLEPMPENAIGKPLRIESVGQSVTIEDVVVGEVWHASGQSNMAMTVGAMSQELDVVRTDIAAANLPLLRFCRINDGASPSPLEDLRQQASWIQAKPQSVGQFSGVAFYFAKRLNSSLGTPVGIIDSSRGGTPIEPFIPQSAFVEHPTLQRELEFGNRGDLESIWRLPGGVRARDDNWLPGRLFYSRLAPLNLFAVRGAIWYQGESNCGVQEDPRDYQHKMRALIHGWRDEFRDKHLPVYFVQLPGSGAGPGWPYLREQQRLAANLPNSGMVVTIDLTGEGIHPPNKIDVGDRLARWALAKEHRQAIAFSGPMFDRQEIVGNEVIVSFQYAESGLMVASKEGLLEPKETPDTDLTNFEIADNSSTWHPATATIRGKTVLVSNPHVTSPTAVRYAYSVTPENCNLYNRDGLPASPFCSRPELLMYDPMLPD